MIDRGILSALSSRRHAWAVIVALLASLVIAEVFLRVLPTNFRENVERYEYMRTRNLLQTEFCEADRNPYIGWHNMPNRSGIFQNREFSVPMRFNRFGLRGADPVLDQPYDRRLLVLGDSHTVGWGVEEQDTFPERLSREHLNWLVLNGGVPGVGTRAQALLLIRWQPIFQPTDVLLLFTQNDPKESNHLVPFEGLIQHQRNIRAIPGATYIQKLVFYIRHPPVKRQDLPYYETSDPNDWAVCQVALEMIQATCKQHACRLWIAYMPSRDEATDLQARGGYRVLMQKYCEQRRIPFLDLTRLFHEQDRPKQAFFQLDEHLNARGHQMVATACLRFFEAAPK